MTQGSYLFAALASAAAGLALAAGAAETGGLIDAVAAHVNNHTITVSEVLAEAQPDIRKLSAKYAGEELRGHLREIYRLNLQERIEYYLILDDYEKQKGRLPEWVIEQRVNEIINERFNGDRLTLMTKLEEDGLPYETWYANMRNHFIVSSMRRANVDEHVRVSPAEARRIYEANAEAYRVPGRVKLRMMTVRQDEPARGLRAVRARLDAGEDFAAVAKECSRDTYAAAGGDWGWRERGDLNERVAAAIWDARAEGKRLGMTELGAGGEAVVFQIEAWEDPAVVPFERALPEIEREIKRRETARLTADWIGRLKAAAYVKILDVDVF